VTGTLRITVTLAIFATMLVLVVVRPRRWNEAWWTVAGAAAMLVLGLVTPREALDATLAGKSALLFLLSLLLLSMLVGKSGFFDWAAIRCARLSNGKTPALFRNVFVLGAIVTAAMSLDTTAVMLTPVVLVIAKRLQLPTAPFVVVCAFVANVGSLLLPISNLTNLLFADTFHLTFAAFASKMLVPQLVALATTFGLLRWHFRRELPARFAQIKLPSPASVVPHHLYFQLCVGVLVFVLAGYFAAPLIGVEPYVIAFVGAGVLLLAGLATGRVQAGAIDEISWSVFPLVVGLFVAVTAIENLGIVPIVSTWLVQLHGHPAAQLGVTSGATAVASNIMNNLPAALLARSTLSAAHADVSQALAALIGANVGPMITPFGSLATILVLTLARRAGAELPTKRLLLLALWMTPIILLATLVSLGAANT
jgi:arsenical pump membrane protein